MIMLNQTQNKESVGVVVKTTEKVWLPTNKVNKEMSISDSSAISTVPGNIGPEESTHKESKIDINENDYSFVNTHETEEGVTARKSTCK